MANKFSKSIMDRLEQEAQRQRTVNGSDPPYSPADQPVPMAENRKLPELSGYLQSSVRRRAKGKTLYLDEELIDALNRTASSKGVSESRLVNDILRSVLGI